MGPSGCFHQWYSGTAVRTNGSRTLSSQVRLQLFSMEKTLYAIDERRRHAATLGRASLCHELYILLVPGLLSSRCWHLRWCAACIMPWHAAQFAFDSDEACMDIFFHTIGSLLATS